MDNVELLRLAATFPCDPRHKQLLLESANELEILTRSLRIAGGYICSTNGYKHMTADQVVTMIRDAVIRGDKEDD